MKKIINFILLIGVCILFGGCVNEEDRNNHSKKRLVEVEEPQVYNTANGNYDKNIPYLDITNRFSLEYIKNNGTNVPSVMLVLDKKFGNVYLIVSNSPIFEIK